MFNFMFGSRKKSKGSGDVGAEAMERSDDYVVIDQGGSTHLSSLYPPLDGPAYPSHRPPPPLPYPLATPTSNLLLSNSESSDTKLACAEKWDLLAGVPFKLASSFGTGFDLDSLQVLMTKSRGILDSDPYVMFNYDFSLEKTVLRAMEYVGGALAGVGACCFTNPLDVVKTRLQLQGELQARGQHVVHYKNTLHAVYTVARNDGILALQKGLVPALWFQVFLNGIRLGTFGKMEALGLTRKADGGVSVMRTIVVSASGGCLGSYIASPLYLVKTHLQSKAVSQIAVGHQHDHAGTVSALVKIYRKDGVKGLWRGSISSLPRIGVGSAAQLSSFSAAKEFLELHEVLSQEKSLLNTFAASMMSGVVVAVFMTPFDVVQTRLYNQGVDDKGRGLFYSSIPDCFVKMWRTEGVLGFFKGLGPCYLRIGPHTVLCLLFWDFFNKVRGV